MDSNSVHSHNTEVAFDPLEVIATHRMQEKWQEDWVSQTLCQVNDCVVRLGAGHDKFHWHKHNNEDE